MGPGHPGAQTGGMQKVFIVEDSPILRKRVEQIVGALPGTVVVGHAASAREALFSILAHRPDVVLLDLCLEDSSGFDVLRELSRREPGIDVYMLSNFASEPYRRHAERLGAKGFFDKTNEFERVRDVIASRAAH
jgi:two-component system, NarL family, response regulator DevR